MDVQNFENLQKSQDLGIFLSDLFESTTFIGPFFPEFYGDSFCFFTKSLKIFFFHFSKIWFFQIKKSEIPRYGISCAMLPPLH